jgi:hypothetical protein
VKGGAHQMNLAALKAVLIFSAAAAAFTAAR